MNHTRPDANPTTITAHPTPIPARKLRPRDRAPAALTTLRAGSYAMIELPQPRKRDGVDALLGVVEAVDHVAVRIRPFHTRVVTTTRLYRYTRRQTDWRELDDPLPTVVPWARIASILVGRDGPQGGRPEEVIALSEVRAVAGERVSA